MPRRLSASMPPRPAISCVLQLELAERVGQVAGDRKGAALGQHMHARSAADQRRRTGQVGGRDAVLEVAQFVDRFTDELVQHIGRGRRRTALAAHAVDALAVAARAFEQARAKQLLHVAEPGEFKRVGKTDQRRRLHVGSFRHGGHRAQRQLVRPLEREACDLLQLPRQARIGRRDRVLQVFDRWRCGSSKWALQMSDRQGVVEHLFLHV